MYDFEKTENWILFDGGKYAQACCHCGKEIPASNPRWWLKTEMSPLKKAVIRHPNCQPSINFNNRGEKVVWVDGRPIIARRAKEVA